MKNKTILFLVLGIFVIALLIFFVQSSGANSYENINSVKGDVEIYKSLTCGCCSVYSQYFNSKTSANVKTSDVQDTSKIKREYGVPSELESCHTTLIGDYFVEGHIPLEAVEKLLSERPDIAGIAMPGMPSGSPGMPGGKYGDFVIYAVNRDGTYDEFMRI